MHLTGEVLKMLTHNRIFGQTYTVADLEGFKVPTELMYTLPSGPVEDTLITIIQGGLLSNDVLF